MTYICVCTGEDIGTVPARAVCFSLLGTLQHELGTAFKYAENFSILQLCKFCCISRREGKIYCQVM